MSKSFMNWSSGKDACYSLLAIKPHLKPELLFTTISKELQRVSMHGLHKSLLEQQAKALNIPLRIAELEKSSSHAAYEKLMQEEMAQLKAQGFETAIFGDIFLEDLKLYRERMLSTVPMEAHFPLWKKDSKILAKEIIKSGIKAIVVCVDGQKLPEDFAGRIYNEQFLNDLPEKIDPCGENGEFHTFCFDGPMFKNPVDFELGGINKSTYPVPKGSESHLTEYVFYFRDLIAKHG
ncbi:adenine nucleotide alpha hydrolase [Luteibaculum oceani]|uniref:Adenine nucleotide alpha hydrolase n=1 Tax=Luteibaculum oceani TaxID=1294296 RepID=A0A5C6V2D3_9FLAO|nr:adenine nucleotide alpha hydrolase [Luteibaculum oceani]TXC78626.1 adenine nucleotide alpha hydrolase [Luteibaculum oceani]